MLKSIVATFHTVMGSSLSQQSAVDTISQWRSRPSQLIYDAGAEMGRYLQAVIRLQQSPNTKVTDDLMATAMARLKREFDAVLRRQADYYAGPAASTNEWSSIADSTANVFRYDDYILPDLPAPDVIAYLRNIAERLNSTGKLGDCVEVYVSVRKPFLQSQLKKLKFSEVTTSCNPTWCEGDELKVKMELWVELAKICVKKLFKREREIGDLIFEGIGDNNDAKDKCFVDTVIDFAQGLFSFVEAVSNTKQSYDKMETNLALHSAFLEVLPEANGLFLSAAGNGIRQTCTETLSRIESGVGEMLCEFERDVLNEKSKVVDGKGAVDQWSTEYAMEQIKFMVKKRDLLTKLINSAPSLAFGKTIIPHEDLGDVSDRTFIQRHLILIIVVLQKNLKTKSDTFPDALLGQLFLMNNMHYIFQEVKASPELQEMIGDAYLNKLQDNLNSAVNSYKTSTCNMFLECFQEQGLYTSRWCFCLGPSKTAFGKKLIAFNSAYEKAKSLGTIPDAKLREGIRRSMAAILVPEYRKFLDKFTNNPDIALTGKEAVRYSAEDFEGLVLRQLFAGSEVAVRTE